MVSVNAFISQALQSFNCSLWPDVCQMAIICLKTAQKLAKTLLVILNCSFELKL